MEDGFATRIDWLPNPQTRWALLLGAAFGLGFAALGLQPHDRQTWALENTIALPFVVGLLVSAWRRPLTRGAYVGIFAFLALHELGSHYTYSLVPYDAWIETVTGRSLNSALGWERNHYDRLVHLLFGLLLALPMREVLGRNVATGEGKLNILTIASMMALSSLYEMAEWAAAAVVASEPGLAFVGAQGDPWDAQKDSGLALLGTAVALGARSLWRRGRASP